jgi:hypothetical protein
MDGGLQQRGGLQGAVGMGGGVLLPVGLGVGDVDGDSEGAADGDSEGEADGDSGEGKPCWPKDFLPFCPP